LRLHFLVILSIRFYAMSRQYSGYIASKSATYSSADLNQCNNSEYLPNLFAPFADFAEKVFCVFIQHSAAC